MLFYNYTLECNLKVTIDSGGDSPNDKDDTYGRFSDKSLAELSETAEE